jgi:hypothetical protein
MVKKLLHNILCGQANSQFGHDQKGSEACEDFFTQ